MSKRSTTNTMKGRFVFIFLVIIIIAGVWFLFLRNTELGTAQASDILHGKWQRTDGPYTIEIVEVMDEGKMTAAYFNPNPIHVGRSGWRAKDNVLEIFVELQDKNYPGSLYELSYDEDKNQLIGIYYQAVTKQNYEVVFDEK